MIVVRPEQPKDIAASRAANEAAFGQSAEADIVASLLQACPDFLSLVATEGSAHPRPHLLQPHLRPRHKPAKGGAYDLTLETSGGR